MIFLCFDANGRIPLTCAVSNGCRQMNVWQFLKGRIVTLWDAFRVLFRPVLFLFIYNAMPNATE